jgi:hypothetical protein
VNRIVKPTATYSVPRDASELLRPQHRVHEGREGRSAQQQRKQGHDFTYVRSHRLTKASIAADVASPSTIIPTTNFRPPSRPWPPGDVLSRQHGRRWLSSDQRMPEKVLKGTVVSSGLPAHRSQSDSRPMARSASTVDGPGPARSSCEAGRRASTGAPAARRRSGPRQP